MLRDVVRGRHWAHAPVIQAASHFYHEKRVAWVSISMHACDPVPIVIGLRLAGFGPPELRYNVLFSFSLVRRQGTKLLPIHFWRARLVECYPQGPHEMGSCREEEKRKAEIGMEKISGKRIERGWLGLEPDPTVDSWQEHYQERSIKGVMCYLCTKRISMCVCRLHDSRAVSILPNCSATTELQYYNSRKTFEEIKRNTEKPKRVSKMT